MEPLNVQRPPSPVPTGVDAIPMEEVEEEEEAEEEDSFFELELAGPHSDANKCTTSTRCSVGSAESTDEQERGTFQKSGASASLGEKLFSKRKILPIEGLNRPQSPISLLKSAPKFRIFAFAHSNSAAASAKVEKVIMEEKGQDRGNGLLSLKIKATGNLPFFARSWTSRKAESPDNNIGGSKRFSREAIHKCLKLLKPLYAKVTRKNGGGGGGDTFAGEFQVAASPSPPPKMAGSGKPPTGSRFKQQLGKSRSASAATTWADSPVRMDDSLVQLQDGIQSAILHCKRSLNASRDYSPLSRCDSRSARDKKTTDE